MKLIKKTRIIMLVAFILMLACLLSACGLLKPIEVTVKEVSIVVKDGLDKEGSLYYAQLGQEFNLEANWNKSATVSKTYTWQLFEDNIDKTNELLGTKAKDSKISFVFDAKTSKQYEFKLKINDVESSNTIKVKIKYADLGNLQVVSNVDMVQNVIQMNRGAYEEITLIASYNKDSIDPASNVETTWYINNAIFADAIINDETLTCKFTPDNLWDDSTIIKISITDGVTTKTYEVTIFLFTTYKSVQSVEVAYSGGPLSAIGATGQMIQKQDAPYSPISLDAIVTPLGTNMAADATWKIRTKDGTIVSDEKGRTLTFTPTYGENIITCTIENVESYTFTIFAMPDAQYESTKDKILNIFEWNGNVENHYILDLEDMADFFNYLVSTQDTTIHNVYYAQNSWKDGTSMSTTVFANTDPTDDTTILAQCAQRLDEACNVAMSYSTSTFRLGESSTFGIPSTSTIGSTKEQNTNILTHYSTATTPDTSLPCDSFTKTITVTSSNQLFRALSNFYKPIIPNDKPIIQEIYDTARAILLEICDNEMTEYEKVLAIYDWIITNVAYDDVLYQMSGDTKAYNGYYLEGAILDNKAVCDGKSKAFSLLCGMEGIRSIRVTGIANQPANPSDVSGHAWNKVLIDAPSRNVLGDIVYDGVREWYVIDTTWGDKGIISGGVSKENLMHNYFMLTDEDVSETHHQSIDSLPIANTEFNCYEYLTYPRVNGETGVQTYKVTTQRELGNALEFCAKKAVEAETSWTIEVQVTIPGFGSSNFLTDTVEIMSSPLYYTDPNHRLYSSYALSGVELDSNNIYLITLTI